MRTADRAPRRRLTPSDRRAELLDAAAAAFADAPYADVSVARIAASVGASPALVHHHFGGKRELYLAVIGAAADDLRTRLRLTRGGDRAGTAGANHSDVRNDGVMLGLEEGIEAFVGFVSERRAGWAALYRGQRATDPEIRAVIDSVRADVLDALRHGVLAAGHADGPAVELVLRGYLGFVDEASLAWSELPPGALPPDAVVRAASAALIGALRA